VGWGLGRDTVTVDLQAQTLLTKTQIEDIEHHVNEEIRKGSPVTWSVHSREELEGLSLLRGALKGAAQDLNHLRIVNICGLDMNPCGGTHLQSLGEIQCLKVLGFEKDRNAIRVRWVAGNRALNYFKACVDREAAMTALLAAPSETHMSLIEKLYQDKKDMIKSSKIVADELIGMLASSMATYLRTAALDPQRNYLVYHRHVGDLNFLLNLADMIASTYPQTVLYFSVSDSALTASAEKKKGKVQPTIPVLVYDTTYTLPKSTSGSFILFGPNNIVEALKPEVLGLLNARGGGRPGRMQGTASNLENIEAIRELIQRQLK
jgi:alanyl-tRNA synthetase